MPINFMNRKLYEIDYDAFSNELNSVRIFKEHTIQKKYFSKWIQKLAECDMRICRNAIEPQTTELYRRELQEAPELFQFPIIYGNTTMYIHFRVSRINQLLEYCEIAEEDVENINIDEFITQDGTIHWTATSDKVEIKTQAIILAPIKLRGYDTIVIDGNHRITDAIEKNKKYIRTITLDANALVEGHLFSTEFDELLYVFHNEVAVISSYVEDGVSDEEALKMSYFYTGEIPYYVK